MKLLSGDSFHIKMGKKTPPLKISYCIIIIGAK